MKCFLKTFSHSLWILSLLLGFHPELLVAEPQNTYVPPSAESEAEKARKIYIERFIKFTQDKNVAGRGKDPNGKVVQGGEKSKFNGDDGNTFQSDLTYHDNAYVEFIDGPQKPEAPPGSTPPKEKLNEFVSSHGNLSDSSQLERVIYQKHKEFSEKDQKTPPPPQKGIRFESIFKKETVEVNDDPNDPSKTSEVFRSRIREEIKPEIEQVGKDAFQTIERAAKEPGGENDSELMGNLTFYREAAARASKSLWDSTLANLAQRRSFLSGSGIRLNVATPTCEAWAQAEGQEIEKIKDAKEKQAEQEKLQENVKKCQQMSQTQFSAIQPRFESDPKNPDAPAQLKEKGIKDEDGFERDLRNQLQVMDKVGLNPDQLQSEWKYQLDEFKNEILSETDESGNVSTVQMTNAEQLEEYNKALDKALESRKQTEALAPELKLDEEAIQAKKLQPGTTSILEINKVPDQMLEELGANPTEASSSKSYSELLQEQQTTGTPP